MADIENDAKAVIAETESVVSGFLSAISPQWAKLTGAWKTWTTRKKIIAGVLAVVALGLVWYFGVDVGRLALGSYKSVYAYSMGANATDADVKALGSRLDALEADMRQTQIEVEAIETKLSEPAPAAPVRHKKK